MSGKIVLNLAMSLDGYIADKEGGYDWIAGHGDHSLDTVDQDDYGKFIEDMDIVVMGKNCYEQGFAKDYLEKIVYVASSGHSEKDNRDNIRFISGDIAALILDQKEQGKNIYLFGGGILIDPFIKKNAIDAYIIGIIPIILGAGRSLFLENNPSVPLRLERYFINDGVTILHYSAMG